MSLVSGPGRGGSGTSEQPQPLCVDKHVKYIQSLDTRKDELEYWLTEHLRLSGLYWGLTACHLLGRPDALARQDVVDFVLSCFHDNGGFGAAPGHDAHMLYTVSAVQILATLDAFDALEKLEKDGVGGKARVGQFIASLQDAQTGTFSGDGWQPESDTRFLFGALLALSLLGLLHLVDTTLCVAHVRACANADGGFGNAPGAESHGGQVWTCVGALAVLGRLDAIDDPARLAGWLSERQTDGGGLNGRPEKREDVCYSWWIAASLKILGKLHWIDAAKLAAFILRCQDCEHGGISDRPGNQVDVFHTVFGVAGLSLLGWEGVGAVDEVYCMPKEAVDRVLRR